MHLTKLFASPRPRSTPEAKKFIEWATSKEYIAMIGEKEGWVTIPPDTPKSTYENPKYLAVAPFADKFEPAAEFVDDIKPQTESLINDDFEVWDFEAAVDSMGKGESIKTQFRFR